MSEDQDKKIKLLKDKLLKDLSNKKLSIIYDIIERKNPCSLRIIEWFVSYYSKDYRVVYNLNGKPFNVYSSYKNEQMTSFNKKLFDMYRRMPKFKVKLTDGKVLETTVAQLNFFNWVFKNKILDYIISNLDDIKKDIEKTNNSKKQKKFFENVKVSRVNITIFFE
jgi:hypothetical protein